LTIVLLLISLRLGGNHLLEYAFLFVSKKGEDHAESDARLTGRDLSAQLQPFSRKHFDFQGNYLTQIDPTARINKAASDTKVVKSSRVRAGKPVIPGG